MAKIDAERYKRFINQLCYEGEKVIESREFRDLHYLIKDGEITLLSRKCGQFSVSFKVLNDLIAELEEVRDLWGNINTKKCLL